MINLSERKLYLLERTLEKVGFGKPESIAHRGVQSATLPKNPILT